MTDFKSLSDPNETPEDVATLYSWANLHGAKYRDFSAARAQTREKARLRAEQAIQEQHRRLQEEAEAALATGAWEADSAVEEALPGEGNDFPRLAAVSAIHDSGFAAQQAVEQNRHAADLAAEHAADLAAAHAAEQQAAHEAEERASEEAARAAAEEAARLGDQQAAELAERQAAELAAQQAAEQAAQQALEKAQAEAEARAHAEAEAHARAKAEAQAKAEAEAQAQAEAQAKAAAQAEAQALAEAEAREQEQAARIAEQQAADLAREQAEHAATQAAELAAHEAAKHAAQAAAEQAAAQQPSTQLPAESVIDEDHAIYAPHTFDNNSYTQPQAYRPSPGQPHFSAPQEESPMPSQNSWSTSDTQEPLGRPAWLSSDRPETPSQPAAAPLQSPADDTLQGSRDRMTSRWFALRGIFDGAPPAPEPVPAPIVSRAPVMAVFSLAGGVGKTSMVATLGRALSARGERVLLVDTAAFGLLPFFFGATDQRPGLLRTFSPPGVSSDAPVQLVTLDPDGLAGDTPSQESLSGEIQKFSRGASRVIVDLATASGSTTRRIMRMAPLVLVPVIPDMNSVVSVSSIDAFFEHNSNPAGKPALPFYVLNQFDGSLPLHLDVREVLREQLGDRLLPFALRRTPAMSEALAEGMTVMDYAPGSPLAEDFSTLAGWVKSLSAAATTSYRGVRWSER